MNRRSLSIPIIVLMIAIAGIVASAPRAAPSAAPNDSGQAASDQNKPAAVNQNEPAAALDLDKIKADYLQLPLHFETNEGQVGSAVDYLAHGNGYSMYLAPEGMVVTLRKKPLPKLKFDDAKYTQAEKAAFDAGTAAMGIHVLGGNPQAQVQARDELAGKINYYVGNEPDKWIENVATYGKIEYKQVYPGIDLVYYGNQQRLEFDFVVAPKADPNLIRLDFAGADKAMLEANGDLVLTIDGKEMRQHKPVIYQEVNGVRREIDGSYVLDGTQASFAVGAYDASQTLVIDPILQYSTFLGGNGQEPGYDIDADPAGNIYVTGVTNSMTADTGQGPNTSGQIEPFPIVNPWTFGPAGQGNPNSTTSGALCCGGSDTGRVFVTKMNPTGSALIYSTFLGGFAGFAGVHQKCIAAGGCGSAPGFARGWDSGHGIAADSTGNAYVTGWAESLDFPTTADAARPRHPGPIGCDPGPPNETTGPCYWHHYRDHPRDAFIAKFGPTGQLLYSSLIGGRMGDGGLSVDVADSGPGMGVYVTGINQSPDFFGDDAVSLSSEGPGPGFHYPAVNAYQDSLNVKPVATGGFVVQTTPYPTCTGSTTIVDWSCWRDAFVMRLNYNNLAVPIWSTSLGGTADEGGYGITVNKATGEAVAVGETESTDFPVTPNAFQPCLGGNGGYHAEPTLAKAGDTSTNTGSGPGIGVGLPFPCHFTPTPGVGEANSFRKPNVDGWVAKFAPNGTPVFITYLGGSMDDDIGATLDDKAGDFGKTVALDELGYIYLTGWTESTSAPIAMCGPLPDPNALDGGQPCPYTVPYPTTMGAYITNLPQDPVTICGSQPGFPPPDPDCVPPNRRLHATAMVTKMTPTGQLGPLPNRDSIPGVQRGPVAPAGTTWSTYLGGYGDDAGFVIAVDSLHQVYVGGVGESVNFPGTANSGGLTAAFPLVIPVPGNHYVNHGLTCPNCGKYINGIAPPYDPDRPPQASDGFIVKMKADGSGLIYSSFVGGSGDEVIHGIVHSTRAGSHGIYISGLTGSQDTPPVPEACPPGTDPCPPLPPVPWVVFPVTGTGTGTLPGVASAPTGSGDPPYQPRHGVTRTNYCSVPPALREDETGDWPCSPEPSDPNEDTFIMRLNDAPDEFPAAPVGVGGGAPDFALAATPGNVTIPLQGPGANTGSFSLGINSTAGFADPVQVDMTVSPPTGLTVTPATPLIVSPTGTTYPATTFNLNSTTAGNYTVTITGTASARQRTVIVPVAVVAPDFSIVANPNSISFAQVGGTGTFAVPVTGVGGFSANVTVTPAATPGLTITPASQSVAPGSSGSFNVTASAPGTYNVMIAGSCTACGLGGINLSHSSTIIITARPPDFSLVATPISVTFAQDGSSTFNITVAAIDGFVGTVTLSHSSTPPGLTVTPPSPATSGPPYTAKTYGVSGSSPNTYSVTVTGTSGSLVRTKTVPVTIPSNTGFRNPTANTSANTDGDGDGFGTTPTNAYTDNGLFAVDSNSGAGTGTACDSENKDSHQFYNYGIVIPSGATVTGIEVRLDAKVDAITGTPKMCVQLGGSGTTGAFTTFKSTPTLTAAEATYVLGGAGDSWGQAWTATQLSNANFRVRIVNVSGVGTTDFSLDWVAVKVHYSGGATPPSTTTTITSDTPDPSVVGQPVTVNYTVTSASPGTPTGNVTVSDGAVSCTAAVAAGNCSLTFTTPGTKNLIATYGGGGGFSGSASAAAAHTVNKADTTTTITADLPDPSGVNQAVIVNFTVVANAPGAGTPTGNVTVSDGAGTTCTGTVAAGTCSLTFTSAGAKTLTATYAGDTNFNTSTSAGAPHQVNAASNATTTTITSDTPDPSVVGQPVTVNYSVTSASPGTPTGNVTVSDGAGTTCTGTVAAGSCSLTFTTPGTKNLIATYGGDSTFSGSASAAALHTVNKANTTTAIVSSTPPQPPDSPDPSVVGQAVIVQYAVTPSFPGNGTPSGNVTITASPGAETCTASVAAGSCTLTFTSAGVRTLTATYSGDANFNTSTSAGESHTVNKANATVTITSDTPDPSVVNQAVTVNYTVVATAPGVGTPTGNVTVSDGAISCTASVATGSCSLTFTTTGVKTLTATYAGDANFNTGTSATASHTVNGGTVPGTFNKTSPANNATGQSTSPTLSWGASSGATAYEYCIATTAAGCTTWVSAGTSQSVTVSGLTANTAYFWHVRATNSFGTTYSNGNATARWIFTTGTGTAPGAFGKTAPANSATGVVARPTLTWAASSGATSYEYCIGTSVASCTTWVNRGTNLNAPLTSTNLNPNTVYFWHVRAVNGTGITYSNGNATAHWSFTTGTTPGSFNKTSPANNATGQSTSPTLSWAASTGATSYSYCIATSAAACTTWVNVGTNLSVTVSGLTANTAYFWHVRATNSFGTVYSNGGSTARWTFTTGP